MQQAILSLLFVLITFNLSLGQKISKSDVLAELRFLNEAVVKGHPINYIPDSNTDIEDIILQAAQMPEDSISIIAYTFLLGKATSTIGCSHSSVKSSSLSIKRSPSYLPLSFIIVDTSLYISAADSATWVGQKVLSINGIAATTIVYDLLTYRPSDGGGYAFSRALFNRNSSNLMSFYLSDPKKYRIETEQETLQLDGVKTAYQKKAAAPSNIILQQKSNYYYTIDSIPVLKVSAFAKADIKFFNSVFTLISTSPKANLILDLRGNAGGNRDAAVALTQHLVDTIFSYGILQPKLKPKKYLDAQGKYFLFLSKLKYNFGNASKAKRTAQGLLFTYRYQPKKTTLNAKIYVLTDGLTASAATMLSTWLKGYTDVIFIGHQAGGGYNGNNGGSFPTLSLPKSNIKIAFPVYRLILDPNSNMRQGIIPDIQTTSTKEDILLQRDVEMEMALEQIRF